MAAPAPSSSTDAADLHSSEQEAAFVRSLRNAIAKNSAISFARYSQLATVDSEGFPAVRTVVVRDFYLRNNLVITTDARSPKVAQIKAHPACAAELCWSFPLTNEQFRLRGRVSFVTADSDSAELRALRAKQWQALPPPTRAMFEEPNPSTPTLGAKQQQLGDLDKYEAQPVDAQNPSRNFALLMLKPLQCDHLMLPLTQQDNSKPLHRESLLQAARKAKRFLHKYDGEKQTWSVVELNP